METHSRGESKLSQSRNGGKGFVLFTGARRHELRPVRLVFEELPDWEGKFSAVLELLKRQKNGRPGSDASGNVDGSCNAVRGSQEAREDKPLRFHCFLPGLPLRPFFALTLWTHLLRCSC